MEYGKNETIFYQYIITFLHSFKSNGIIICKRQYSKKVYGGFQGMAHWLYELADKVEEHARKLGKDKIIINGGLSVSGLQHIGRLRGEVLIGEGVRKILESRGYHVEQYIVLYTQDAWKGKNPQRQQFSNPQEAKKYTGWPLIRVPDPMGCHENWVQHYWEDFGGVLDKFTDGKIKTVTTTHLYNTQLKPVVLETIRKKELVREIVNKYRGRNPYPENWVPFEPVCEKCGRIDKTVTIEVKEEKITYRCKACGYQGETFINNGKLNWRLEWAGIWKAMDIDFEPYGKDHATPGGSRDSCKELVIKVFEHEPPEGTPYEWVALRTNGKEMDMSSSDFKGITPREWLEIADPEILRYIYFSTPPRRKIIIDLREIPQYYEEYYEAERNYYKFVQGQSITEEEYKAISYKFAQLKTIPEEMPLQIPYHTIALLVQSLPEEKALENAITRLEKSGLIKKELSSYDKERLSSIIEKSRNWVRKYAPENMRYSILSEVPERILNKLEYKTKLRELGEKLASLEEWSEENIKQIMIEHSKEMSAKERRKFYNEFYLVIIGKPSGPRAAPLANVLGKEFIVKRLVKDLS